MLRASPFFAPLRALVLCLLAALSLPAAAELGPPPGDPILRVTGAIAATNAGDAAEFDRTMLAALGQDTIRTTTIWTEGEQAFTGIWLADLVSVLGVDGGRLLATAVNDYTIEIPFEDTAPGAAFIAFERNGATMSLREKGPLWLIYPYDADPRFRSEVYYSRSIWQLDRIEVVQ